MNTLRLLHDREITLSTIQPHRLLMVWSRSSSRYHKTILRLDGLSPGHLSRRWAICLFVIVSLRLGLIELSSSPPRWTKLFLNLSRNQWFSEPLPTMWVSCSPLVPNSLRRKIILMNATRLRGVYVIFHGNSEIFDVHQLFIFHQMEILCIYWNVPDRE